MDRTSKLALASLIFNIAFAVYHLVLGFVTGSWWLLTLGSAVCIIFSAWIKSCKVQKDII